MNSAHTLPLAQLSSVNRLTKYFMRRWLRRHPAFVRTCRLLMQRGTSTALLRLTYVTKSSNYSAAERSAEEFVARLLHEHAFGSDQVIDIQWKRGRLVTIETLDAEDTHIEKALCRLSQSNQSELLIYDRTEDYQAQAKSAQTPTQA